jgi:phosphoenolpyruvate synthase/pyruvate phosphate dikinase
VTEVQTDPAQLVESPSFVVATETCRPEDLAEVGGKAVGLGTLHRAGQSVPASFVVTAAAYRWYLRERRMAAELQHSIEHAYVRLCALRGATMPVAVRSSATVEDSTEASCAGQFRTFLGARGAAEVVEEVERCWQSALDPHVGAYRAERGLDRTDAGIAVIVQELVDARVAGVMFTQHPRTGDRSLVVVEASFGLGDAVVGGEVTPDLFEVNKITGQIHERSRGSKPVEHRLREDGRGVESRAVDSDRQQSWSATDQEVAAVSDMGIALESQLGRGLDVEWAIGTSGGGVGDEVLYALQVRPITVDPGDGRRASVPEGRAIDFILERLSGTGGTKETS